MRQPSDEILDETVRRAFPWGPPFAMHANFAIGYLPEESRLIVKYLQPHSDVLVLGSGNGREARPICRDGHRIVCIDIGQLYLVYGVRLFVAEGVRDVRFIQADTLNPPFGDASFDWVFFSFYSSLKENRFDALRQVRRLLRDEGLVLFTVCTPRYQDIYGPRVGDWVLMAGEEQLRQEVTACGFEMLESAVDSWKPEYRLAMLRKRDSQDAFVHP